MPQSVDRILVATDFSTPAVAALCRAGSLAHTLGAALELMHVIAPRDASIYRGTGSEASRRSAMADASGTLRALASDTEAKFGIPVTAHLAAGKPHAEIAARAEATGARLVVVGAHGDSCLRDTFVGSTAQRLQRMPVPLLIARNRATRRYVRALVAVDFTPASAEAAHAAASLFPGVGLHFLHVRNPLFEGHLSLAGVGVDAIRAYRNEALFEAGRELDEFIRQNGLQARRASSLVKHGHVAGRIRETASELGASLVVFGATGKSRLQANIMGSVSEEFSRGAGPDVFLANAMVRTGAHQARNPFRRHAPEAEAAAR
jgi:nucleotide-binding universal stress UspA family protein